LNVNGYASICDHEKWGSDFVIRLKIEYNIKKIEAAMNRSKRKAFRTYVTEETGLNSALPLKSPQTNQN